MSSRQRVLKAIAFQTPDRMPRFDSFWPEFTAKWQEDKGLGEDADPSDYYDIDVAVCVGDETFLPSYSGVIEERGDYILRRDGWGRTTRSRKGGYFEEMVDSLLADKAALASLEFASPQLESRYRDFEREVAVCSAAGRAVFVKKGATSAH